MSQRLGSRTRDLRKRLDRPRRVVLRDFVIFEIKLLLDGVKGVGISFLALAALVLDLARPGKSAGHRFYGVMRLGERLDRWLSLYGAAEAAEQDPEGLFGVSRAGSPTLLGRLEAIVHHAVVGEDEGQTFVEEPPSYGSQSDHGADSAIDRRAPPHPAGLFDKGLAALDRAVGALDRNLPDEEPDEDESPPPKATESGQPSAEASADAGNPRPPGDGRPPTPGAAAEPTGPPAGE